MNENEPREDGPALQKLFAAIDGPAKVTHLPSETAFDGAIRVPEDATALCDLKGDPVPAADCTCGAALEGGEHSDGCEYSDGDCVGPCEGEDPVNVGPINYAMCLHQSGEAAIQIVKNMVEAEAAGGNLRAIPEPILGWYCMTMVYQLCVLEATLARYDVRKAHAEALQVARTAFTKYQETEYAQSVMAEVSEVLRDRYRPAALESEQANYRGVLLP